MRLGLDARLFGPEQKGLGRYVQQILPALRLEDAEMVIFARRASIPEILELLPEAECIPTDIPWYSLREQMHMPAIIDNARLDLIHYPHFNVPILARTPFVVTIHDLLLLEFPSTRASLLGPIHYQMKRFGWNAVMKRILHHARAIITPTTTIADSIKHHYNFVDSSKIHPIYLGSDAVRASETPVQNPLENPFFLYVGNIYPHKNIEWLVSVFQIFSWEHPDIRLVLVGSPDPFLKRLREHVMACGLEDVVIFWGKATDDELATLYQYCVGYVFPTRAEGFGIPALEAMRQGAVIITSDIPVLREVLDDAALFFSPNDVSAILEHMGALLSDPMVKNEYRKRGAGRAALFSWDTTRMRTAELYRQLLFHGEEKNRKNNCN